MNDFVGFLLTESVQQPYLRIHYPMKSEYQLLADVPYVDISGSDTKECKLATQRDNESIFSLDFFRPVDQESADTLADEIWAASK